MAWSRAGKEAPCAEHRENMARGTGCKALLGWQEQRSRAWRNDLFLEHREGEKGPLRPWSMARADLRASESLGAFVFCKSMGAS